jgi:predicted MFS family arabinose efflux permease
VLRIPETGQRKPKESPAASLIHRAAVRPGVALFTGVAATSGFLALVGLRATEIGLSTWSLLPLAYGSVVVACRMIFAKVPDRLPPLELGAASLALGTVGLAILAAASGPAGLLGGSVVLALGITFLTPAIFTAVFSLVPADERGAAAGTATIFIDLGIGAGPLTLGFVAAAAGIPLAFAVGGIITAAGAALLLLPRPPDGHFSTSRPQ